MNKLIGLFFLLVFGAGLFFGILSIPYALFSEKIERDDKGIPYKLYCNEYDSNYLISLSDLSRIYSLIESCSEELSKDINVEKFYVRSQGYLYLKEYDKSLSDIKSALKINAKEEKLYHNKIEIYRKQEKFEEMIDEYKNMIKIFPKNEKFYNSLIKDIEIDIFNRDELRLHAEGVKKCLSAPNYFQKISKEKNLNHIAFYSIKKNIKSLQLIFEDDDNMKNISKALILIITSADKIKDSVFEDIGSRQFTIEKDGCNYLLKDEFGTLYFERID